MKHLFRTLLMWVVCAALASAQTQINGVINSYHKITFIDTCLNLLHTQDFHNYVPGDRVLLIQMQGALINESNTAAFGNIFSLGGAGAYELNEIDSVFWNGFHLKNAIRYPYDPQFSVQVVSVPYFTDAVVTDTLTSRPWNGETGGVLVLEADRLELTAPIDVSGMGYRGGKALKSEDLSNNCTWLVSTGDYHVPRNNWRGAEKGEGVASFIVGKEGGRGAQLNGGGGGNDHNSGGGGGANVKKGGQGGRNNDPGAFSCQGPNPGAGGKGIGPSNAENRFFLGGGGGAGHGNNGLGTDGGNGGGIIFLLGKNLISNGNKIISNGRDASTTYGDGGGGGGSGGTIVFDMASVSVSIPTFEAKGGKGAGIDNRSAQRCFGPGGGGSGGRIVYSFSLNANENVGGGSNGSSSNGSCQNSANGSEQGDEGVVEVYAFLNTKAEAFVPLKIEVQPVSDTVCIGTIARISVKATGKGLKYRWQYKPAAGTFVDVPNNAVYTGSLSPMLSINSFSSSIQSYEFRCLVSSICGPTLISESVQIFPDSVPQIAFKLALNGAQLICTNQTTGGSDYLWDFGDGNSTLLSNPIHLYTMDGNYTVGLRATNHCGVNYKKQAIEVVTPPVAGFRADTIEGCAPVKVRFVNTSSQNVNNYFWRFYGADISVSNEKNPEVTYNKEGAYDVKLIVQNAKFTDSIERKSYIRIREKPTADFSYDVKSSAKVTFTNNCSANSSSFLWNTSSGFSTSQRDYVFDFKNDGLYTVSLTAFNSCGSDVVVKNILIETLPTAAFDAKPAKGCLPLTVQFRNLSSLNAQTWSWRFPGAVVDTSSKFEPSALYTNSGTYDVYLICGNNKGSDTISKKAIVIVEDKPVVSFDVKTQNLNAEFENTSTGYHSLSWDFGFDNKISQEVNPSIQYPQKGTYTVTLSAVNDCGERRVTKEITVSDELSCGQIVAGILPNPVSTTVCVLFNARRTINLPYLLSTVDGKIIRNGVIPAGDDFFEVNLENEASGMYVLFFSCQEKKYAFKIMKIDY